MKNILLLKTRQFFIFFLLALPAATIAQTAGPRSGRTFGNAYLSGANQNWINTQNAGSSDGQYASFGNLTDVVGSHTDYLLAAGFGFAVPVNAQITGIVAYVENSDMNSCTGDFNIRIMKNGNIGNTEYSTGALYLNGDAKDSYRTYGGNADLWGETWTAQDINNDNFGIAIAAQRSVKGKETAGRIDNIRLAVYYFTPTTLPVKLSSFTATPKKNMVRLAWTTADEEGMDRYEVQRSVNGADYTSFGTLICKNHPQLTEYSFNDYSPVAGTLTYRLKMLEKSGNIVYSKVIPVQFNADSETTLYPSPWKNGETLFIHNPENKKLSIRFFDTSGGTVTQVTTSSNQVPASSLASAKGILRYKVYDTKEEVSGSGMVFIY